VERRPRAGLERPHLDEIAESCPWLTIVRAVSDEHGHPGERGAIPDVVSRHGPWRDHHFSVAGSGAMVNATLRRLTEMRIPSTRIRYDAFTDA
jgi:NAD(P)H-flavin reductase